MSMSSKRPYLIKAFFDWIVDNDCTPYIVVDAYVADVEVPQEHVIDGQIVLNLAPRAVKNFVMEDDYLSFTTRFGGIPTAIQLPLRAVMGIYARENGQGMMFQPEDEPEAPPPMELLPKQPALGKAETDAKSGRPSLRVIK